MQIGNHRPFSGIHKSMDILAPAQVSSSVKIKIVFVRALECMDIACSSLIPSTRRPVRQEWCRPLAPVNNALASMVSC